ncbi:MAG TPA: hypothetical protein VGM53_33815 [Streptosporangiaceae bacterium]|jgi:hypothetical protein
MLLLVVGLVVLVLVIVVVVFLSVRSMHVEDDDGFGMSTARRDTGGRDSAERDSGARRMANGAMNGGRRYGEAAPPPAARPRASQPVPPARASQPVPAPRRRPPGDAQPEPPRRGPGVRRGGGRDREEQRVPALPRPRGNEHDQDASDWGGVSDEQYWAELSSDRPLATTARSAQPGHPADRAASPRRRGDDDTRQSGNRQSGDTAAFRDPRSGEGPFGEAQFGEGPFGDAPFGEAQFADTPFRNAAAPADTPFRNGAAPAGTTDTSDTDPGRDAGRTDRAAAGRDGSWGAAQPSASGWAADGPATSWGAQETPTTAWSAADSPTTAWQAPEPSTADWPAAGGSRREWDAADTPGASLASRGPAWAGADEAAGDWRADEPSADRWAASDDPGGRSSADTGDALTSDAFSPHDAHAAGRDRYHSAPAPDRAEPGWQDAGPADYDEPYGGRQGSGGGYRHGELEPLPEPAGHGSEWHSAPVASGDDFAAGQDGHGWGNAAGYGHDGYPDADRRGGYADSSQDWEPHGTGADWPDAQTGNWGDQGQPGWQVQEPAFGQNGGYHPDQGFGEPGGYHQDQRYGQPGGYGDQDHTRPGSHRGQDTGHGPESHDTAPPGTAAYDLPAYDTAGNGYGDQAGYDQPPRHGYGSR